MDGVAKQVAFTEVVLALDSWHAVRTFPLVYEESHTPATLLQYCSTTH
jgi:hypothetical protein